MDAVLIIIFWFSLAGIVYPYTGYPLLLLLLVAIKGRSAVDYPRIIPSLSLLIPAHNEEAVIEKKIKSSLGLDYPEDKLEIIVISDGSTDRTNEILANFNDSRLKVIRLEERKGKNQALNRAMKTAAGDIIVFTDANAIFDRNALLELVRPFNNPRIGCVVGKLHYENPKNNLIGNLENLYWRVENLLKSWEGRLNYLLGANGSIFAIRRDLWEPVDDTVHEDFIIPIRIIEKGFYNIYRPEAMVREEAATAAEQEFNRRTRIVWKGWVAIRMIWTGLFHPLRPILIFELISRKIFKRLVWLFMILCFFSSLFLFGQSFYRGIFILQAVFLAAAGIGWIGSNRKKKIPVFYYPYSILGLSLANMAGFIDFIRGKEPEGTWKIHRPVEN